jgi:hypothetical protein
VETVEIVQEVLKDEPDISRESLTGSLYFGLRGRSARFTLQCGSNAVVYQIADQGRITKKNPKPSEGELVQYVLRNGAKNRRFFVLLYGDPVEVTRILGKKTKANAIPVAISEVLHTGGDILWSQPQKLHTSITKYQGGDYTAPLMVSVVNDMMFGEVTLQARYFKQAPPAQQETAERETPELFTTHLKNSAPEIPIFMIEMENSDQEEQTAMIGMSVTGDSEQFEVKYRLRVRKSTETPAKADSDSQNGPLPPFVPPSPKPTETPAKADSDSQNGPPSPFVPPSPNPVLVIHKGNTEMNRHLSYESREPSFSMYGLRAPRF